MGHTCGRAPSPEWHEVGSAQRTPESEGQCPPNRTEFKNRLKARGRGKLLAKVRLEPQKTPMSMHKPGPAGAAETPRRQLNTASALTPEGAAGLGSASASAWASAPATAKGRGRRLRRRRFRSAGRAACSRPRASSSVLGARLNPSATSPELSTTTRRTAGNEESQSHPGRASRTPRRGGPHEQHLQRESPPPGVDGQLLAGSYPEESTSQRLVVPAGDRGTDDVTKQAAPRNVRPAVRDSRSVLEVEHRVRFPQEGIRAARSKLAHRVDTVHTTHGVEDGNRDGPRRLDHGTLQGKVSMSSPPARSLSQKRSLRLIETKRIEGSLQRIARRPGGASDQVARQPKQLCQSCSQRCLLRRQVGEDRCGQSPFRESGRLLVVVVVEVVGEVRKPEAAPFAPNPTRGGELWSNPISFAMSLSALPKFRASRSRGGGKSGEVAAPARGPWALAGPAAAAGGGCPGSRGAAAARVGDGAGGVFRLPSRSEDNTPPSACSMRCRLPVTASSAAVGIGCCDGRLPMAPGPAAARRPSAARARSPSDEADTKPSNPK